MLRVEKSMDTLFIVNKIFFSNPHSFLLRKIECSTKNVLIFVCPIVCLLENQRAETLLIQIKILTLNNLHYCNVLSSLTSRLKSLTVLKLIILHSWIEQGQGYWKFQKEQLLCFKTQNTRITNIISLSVSFFKFTDKS